MNTAWLDLLPVRLEHEPAVALVTVAHVEGSAPRDAGTSFLVSASRCDGTIGGGHLEFEAIREARAMLAGHSPLRLKRYALGPSLGQCCGGVVWLLFELIPAEERLRWQALASRVRSGEALVRSAQRSQPASAWSLRTETETRVEFQLLGEDWRFAHTLARQPFPIFVFGAGHVGEAIVRALAPLSSEITWIDSRDDAFPADLPPGVLPRWSDAPADEIAEAPRDTCFLVLTHSHDLDLLLCEKILARGDFAFFGLIGSKSKRARFEHQLSARGLDTTRMTCPIGIAGIRGKSPAIIAIAVAAQLAQVREALITQAPALELH